MNCKHCKKDILEGATKCPECQSDLRNWFARHKILSGLLGLFVLGLILSAVGSSDTAPEVAQNTTPKEYTKVISLNTSSTKNSDSFSLIGGKQKLVYTVVEKPFAGCNVYLLNEGTDLQEDGGFPVVLLAEENGETILRKGSGNYYLSVQATNTNCSVELSEER